jgi:hypothetical protein
MGYRSAEPLHVSIALRIEREFFTGLCSNRNGKAFSTTPERGLITTTLNYIASRELVGFNHPACGEFYLAL